MPVTSPGRPWEVIGRGAVDKPVAVTYLTLLRRLVGIKCLELFICMVGGCV